MDHTYCGIHMGVNLAVSFDACLKAHSSAPGHVTANVEGEQEDGTDQENPDEDEVEFILGSCKVVIQKDGEPNGESCEYLVKWFG